MSMAPVIERPARLRSAPARPIGVAYLIDRLGVGGTETQLLGLIARLDRRRVRPILCLLDGESDESRALEPAECPVLRLGVRSLRRTSNAAKAWRFRRFLREHEAQVLQLHFPDSTYFGAPLGRLAGVRGVVATSRDLAYWATPRDCRVMRMLHRLFVDATLANSQACASAAIDRLGAAPSRMTVLPNGIELPHLAPIDKPADHPAVIGMVANLREVKSPQTFVAAAAQVARRHPRAQFVIAGEGPLRSALVAQAESLGIASQLRLPGALADMPRRLATFDVAVLCSESEGLSNAVLEYMAAARPIVCTAVGGNLELIEHERNGLLVPPRDADALAAAILRLLDDRALAERLGSAARRSVEHDFAWESVAARHADFYEQLALGRAVDSTRVGSAAQ